MSTPLHQNAEKLTPDDDDRTPRGSDLLKEFKHTSAGVWDVYEQIPYSWSFSDIPLVSKLVHNVKVIEDLSFVWRMVKDIAKIKSCWYYMCALALVKLLAALQPAVALWCVILLKLKFRTHLTPSAKVHRPLPHYCSYPPDITYKFLSESQVQIVMNERRVDEKLFIFASTGRICCKVAETLFKYWEVKLEYPLGLLVKEHSEKEVFNVVVSLDVPTFNDRAVKRSLNDVSGCAGSYGVMWDSLSLILSLLFSVIRLVGELIVLARVISGQQDGITYAVMHLGQELFQLLVTPDWIFSNGYG